MRGQAPAPPGGGSSGGGPGGSHSRAAADLRGRPLHRAHPRQAAAGGEKQGGTRHQEPTEPDWRHWLGTGDEGRPQTRWRLAGIFGNPPSPSATCQQWRPSPSPPPGAVVGHGFLEPHSLKLPFWKVTAGTVRSHSSQLGGVAALWHTASTVLTSGTATHVNINTG